MTTVIALDGVRKSIQGREILKGVSLEVHQGDVFGFLGPNGAGKTTTIRILLGLYAADAGTATIAGLPAGSDEVRSRVGFMLDNDGLYQGATAVDNLAFFLRLYRRPVDLDRINHVLDLVGLRDRAGSRPGEFSKGMRQRLALARALVHDPDVVILDEPTSGVDPSAQVEIRKIMSEVCADEGKTVLLSSHNMDEVQRVCNRVALLNKGEVVLYGELEELRDRMGQGTVTIETDAPVDSATFGRLEARSGLGLRERVGNGLLFAPENGTDVSAIVAELAAAGVGISKVTKNEASLEDMYLSLVRESEPA